MNPNTRSEIRIRDRFDAPDWSTRLAEFSQDDWEAIRRSGDDRPAIDRVKNLQKWLNRVFVDRAELIDLMLCCTTAQIPMLLLGTWGTGKTLLVRKFAAAMGITTTLIPINREDGILSDLLRDGGAGPASEDSDFGRGGSRRHFDYMVTRFTTPEELLGTAHIDLILKKAMYLRQTRGMLPRAEVVFLDEVFKANSSILNALLAIINERVFHNAGRAWGVNLLMLFAASNEPPLEGDLGAFYDRLPVRFQCLPVTNENLGELLRVSFEDSYDRSFPPVEGPRDASELPCVNDFRLLHRMSLIRFGGRALSDGSEEGDTFQDRFIQLFRYLRLRYDLSDRSFGQFYRLARADALLNGRDHLLPEDASVLMYCGKGADEASELRGAVGDFLR